MRTIYGSDTTQAGTLAATGITLSTWGYFVASAALIFAGLALLTAVQVIWARKNKAKS